MFHLVIWEVEEAGEDDHEVGFLQGFEAFDIGGAGFDFALFIDAEEDGAFEAVVLGEDACEGWACFLGAVFVVGCDEDDVFTFSWS